MNIKNIKGIEKIAFTATKKCFVICPPVNFFKKGDCLLPKIPTLNIREIIALQMRIQSTRSALLSSVCWVFAE
jgi:hypothetical protein